MSTPSSSLAPPLTSDLLEDQTPASQAQASESLESESEAVSEAESEAVSEAESEEGLYLVKRLGAGAEGETFLMADKTGACCAIKFYEWDTSDYGTQPSRAEYEATCRQMCFEEHAAWMRAYGEDCEVRVVTLVKREVLLMPYFHKISVEDWEEPDTMNRAMEHIMELFHKGVYHTDLELRHVMWKDNVEKSVVLIDWGSATNTWHNRRFSEAEYRSYAEQQLQEGIVRIKERASRRSRQRKADEAQGHERAEKALQVLKAAAQKAAQAAAEAGAEEAAAATAAAEEAERVVQKLEAAIATAVLAKEEVANSAARARSALMSARKVHTEVKAGTATQDDLQRARNELRTAVLAAEQAERDIVIADSTVFTLSFRHLFSPVDDYEADGYPPDTFTESDLLPAHEQE